MVNQLNESNQLRVKQFIISNLDISGFSYGNLKNENKIVRFIEHNDEIVGLYIIINNLYITYVVAENCPLGGVELLICDAQNYIHTAGTIINGNVDLFKKYYKLGANYQNDVAVIYEQTPVKSDGRARFMDNADLPQYIKSISKIDEFPSRPDEEYRKTINDIQSRVAVVEIDGEIVAAASLVSISELSAVVTSVFCLKEHRGNGYARSALDLLLEKYNNRSIYIFFSNPIAKQIYIERGFQINNKLLMFSK